MKPMVVRLLMVTWAVLFASASRSETREPIEFNRDIRPILAENCFACHGPDSASREADLRLDRREEAIDYGAITPSDPEDSSLVYRVFAEDSDERMPPPDSHKVLTQSEKELLRQWIAAGAEYQPHWSFLAASRPPLPAVSDEGWVRNPIDRFILAKLDEMGLQPTPEADRRTLARRVSLDLIGLPPKPEEVEDFVTDPSPDAYERFVDRLLESPHWGEHRGRYWLDVARYADTHGLHFDNYREIWSYRDWIIEAFNRNMPFDQFTVEQLAGDLLPEPTLDQRIATGFNRSNITTNEGGTIQEENLVLYTRDRTETFARTWLGLTANCAVCHDHKFDPLKQKEFYELSAYFNNTTQGAMDGNIKDTPPVVVVAPPEDRERWGALARLVPEAKRRIEERKQSARPDFDRWLSESTATPESLAVPTNGLLVHAALDEGPGEKVHLTLAGKMLALPAAPKTGWEPGHVAAQAIRIPAEAAIQVTEAGDFEKGQAFSYGAWIKLDKDHQTGAVAARMDDRQGHRGWDLWVEGGRVGSHIIHSWSDDALKVVSTESVKPGTWNHVFVTYDGSGKAAGVKVYVNGDPQKTKTAADSLKNSIRTGVPLSLGSRHTGSRLEAAVVQDLRIYGRALKPREVRRIAQNTRTAWLIAKPADQRSDAEKDELYGWWLSAVDEEHGRLSEEAAALEKEQAAIRSRSTVAYVSQEKDTPPKAYVLNRGQYDERGEEVTPGTPAFLPPMPDDLPRNRLGLARWLLRPEQPLTARVVVNRFWQEVFGTGIVKTSEDFGATGEMPTHPELLDWLAVEFRESGWDVKSLIRLIVTSATYRQSSAVTPEKLEKDPDNRYLARGPRFRMDAEMIRDYALAAGGLLAPKIGGPSVKPYQPPGVWEAVAMIGSNTRDYKQDSGDALYRRSMYTFWKRAAPPASMDIFNAPSREFCTARRERTNTPLQALATLNDPQFVEAARHLAETALLEGGPSDRGRMELMAERLLARPLGPDETKIAEASLARLREFYRANPEEAKLLVSVGESKPDKSLPPQSLAAWTMLANQLMNLDEVLCK